MTHAIKTVAALKDAFFDAVDNTGIQPIDGNSLDAFIAAVEQYTDHCTESGVAVAVDPSMRTLKAWHGEHLANVERWAGA